MRLLLDTQILIWSIMKTRRLSAAVRTIVEDPENEKCFSAVSVWETAIKSSLRRPDFDVDPRHLLTTARMDFLELPITADAAVRVASLPWHHRDPFDRLLVAQAIDEDVTLVTADATLAAYGSHIMLVS